MIALGPLELSFSSGSSRLKNENFKETILDGSEIQVTVSTLKSASSDALRAYCN